MIEVVGPGGSIHIAADEGPYRLTDPITISRSGGPGKPVRIIGMGNRGRPDKAVLVGARTNPYPTTEASFARMNHGKDCFRLERGADHLHLSFLKFENVGNGAILIRGNIADLTLEDIVAKNLSRFVERAEGNECSVTGLTIRRVSVLGFSKSAVRLDQNTSSVLMEDVLGDSMRQEFDNFPEGIDLSGQVHDVVCRRCTMRNSQQRLGSDQFWNGDGFTAEPGTYNLLFEDCVASDNTDAGFDLKANHLTLRRCKSYANTANFKLWGKQDVVMDECVSEGPRHIGGTQDPKHVTALWGAKVLIQACRFIDHNHDAVVYHTEANTNATPPIGSVINVVNSSVSSSGKLSYMDRNSKITIDGIARPGDRR